MKMKNMIAVLSAAAVSAMGMAAMSFSASAADEIAQAYLAGSFGTESNWDPGENSGVSVTSVDGDAQYECTWTLAQATNTGGDYFITVVITPTGAGVDTFTTDTFENLNVTLDEVWVDGVQLSGYDASGAVNTAYYENGVGVSRIYLHDDWAGTKTNIIDYNTDITTDIKVVFTVSGTGVEGTSNVSGAPAATEPEESSKEESSAVEESSKEESKTESSKTESTSSSTTTTGGTTTNTPTGDAGVAALVAAAAVAGAAIAVTAKKNK